MLNSNSRLFLYKSVLCCFILFLSFTTYAQICTKYEISPDTVNINTATVFNVQEKTGGTLPPELWLCNWIDFDNDGAHECTGTNSCQFTFTTGGLHAVSYEINEFFIGNTAVCTSYVFVAECNPGTILATANGMSDTVISCVGTPVTLNLNASSGQYCTGNWEYLWYNGSLYYDGVGFNSTVKVWNASYQNVIVSSLDSSVTYRAKIRCSAIPTCIDSSKVYVNIKPTAYTLSGGGGYCVGANGLDVVLSSSQTDVSYQLLKNGNPSGSPVNGTGNSLIWNNLIAGTYTVTASYGLITNCNNMMTGSIVITEVPVTTVNQISNFAGCCATPINFGDFISNPPGATFTWTNSNTNLGLPASGSGNIATWMAYCNYTGVDIIGTITVTPTLNGCTGTPMSFTVTIYPVSIVNQISNIAVCPGSTINIGNFVSMPYGASFAWTNSNTAIGLAASGSGNISSWTAPTNSTGSDIVSTITVTPTLAGCPGTPMSFTVTIYPTPSVTQITNITVCQGGTINIGNFVSNPSGATFSWTNSNTDIGLAPSGTGNIASWIAPVNSIGTSIEGDIIVTPTLNGCPGIPMSFTVTIKPTPVVIPINNIAVCPGSTINIGNFVSDPVGASFAWTNSNTSIGLAPSGTGNILSWVAPVNNGTCANIVGTITVTPSLNGCTGTPMSFTVTIYPTPVVTPMTNIFACPGTTINIGNFTSCPSGATYSWNNSNTNIGLLASGSGNIASWTAPTNNTCVNIVGTIYVFPTLNGCQGTPMTFTVTIYPTPIISQKPDIVVCPGSTIDIGTFTTCPTSVSFSWTNSNIAIGLPSSGGGFSPWTAPANNTGANIVGTITVTPSSSSCVGPPMSFTITISPTPTVFNFSGAGVYCAGSTSSDTLSGSQLGVNYQLKKNGVDEGAVVSGTGNALIWNNLTAGTYMVVATYTTAPYCVADMNGSVIITENALPVAGAGADQAIPYGTTTTLSATASGGSGPYSFSWEPAVLVLNPNSQTTNTNAINADTYFIVTVQDANTLCTHSDTMFIDVIMPLTVTASALANNICENDTVFLNALASGGTEIYTYLWSSNPAGFSADSANPIAVPLLNTVYTVTVSDGANTATSSISVTISPRPEQFILGNDTSYCQGSAGVDIFLENSYSDVFYQLYKNGQPYGTSLQGIDMALTWSNITSGTYTAIGTFDYAPSCAIQMIGTVTVTESLSPVVFNATGSGVYCQGGTGLSVYLSGSETGINYQLFKNGNPSGAPQSGTGNALEWVSQLNGSYTITATYASSPYCASNMNGTVVITQTTSLNVYNLSGGGSYCAGSTGSSVTLSGSQVGVSYQLKKNGVDQGAVVAGTGSALIWSNLSAGTYTVVGSATLNCVADMNGSVVITESPLPAVFNLTGSAALCSGGSDTLSGSQIGVSYQLKKDGTYTGSAVNGTGSALVWSNLTSGTYTVVATFDAFPYCMAEMNGSVVIVESPLTTITQINNIAVCPGSTINIGNFVSNPTGATFEWTNSNTAIGLSAVGTGNIAAWTAPANSTCTNIISTITVTPSLNGCAGTPMSFTVTIYPSPFVGQLTNIIVCPGSLINIGTFTSCPGATFSWTNSNTAIGISASGSGNIASWIAPANSTGANIVGIITVIATLNGCQGPPMCIFSVTICPTPTIFNLTGGGAYCTGGNGLSDTLSGSQIGVNYQLLKNGVNLGAAVAGTGNALVWTNLTAGTYMVVATNATAPYCVADMIGNISITEYSTPMVFAGADQVITQGGVVNLDATVTGGSGSYTYHWMPDSLVVNPTSHATTTLPIVNSVYFIIYVTDNQTACTDTDFVSIVVAGGQLSVMAYAQPNSVCVGDTVFLSALADGGSGVYNYTWSSIPSGFNANVKDTFAIPGTSTLYTVMVDDGSMMATNAVNVVVNTPADVILGVDTTLCLSQNITLTGPTGTGYNYTWIRLPDDTLSTVQALYLDTTISGTGTFTYVCIVSNTNNCFNSDTINVEFDICITITEINDYSIAVFPNPAKDNLTIAYSKLKPGVYSIEIFNILSQRMLYENINVKEASGSYLLDISALSKGVYNLSLSNNKTLIYNLKLVVN